MNFAQLLMTGPMLVAKVDNRFAKYDEHFVRDVIVQCLPGTTDEVVKASGYGVRKVEKCLQAMLDEGKVSKRSRRTERGGYCRIYERALSC